MLKALFNKIKQMVAAIRGALLWRIQAPSTEIKGAPQIKQVPCTVFRDWQINFGPITGKKGDIKWAVIEPLVLFRGEKLLAIDHALGADGCVHYESSPNDGKRTRVLACMVGTKLQFPLLPENDKIFGSGGMLTSVYVSTLADGVKYTTCQMGLSIAYLVAFDEDCVWEAALYGRAIE